MNRGLSAFAICVLASWGTPASSEVVRTRFVLPSDGTPVDIAPMVADLEGPVRVVLSGTLTSSLDGSEIDAFGRVLGDRRDETTGPFVRLPRNTRLVEADLAVNRYVLEVPSDGPLPLALHLAPLAARRLVTLSELETSCTGAIEVEIVGPRFASLTVDPGGKASVARPADSTTSPLVALGLSALALMSIGGVLARRRRRGRSTAHLIRRCRAAHREVQRGAGGLGPAFGYVITASADLLDAALRSRDHLAALRSARNRTARLSAEDAVEERERLRQRQQTTIVHLAGIAERLEATAAELIARRAEQTRVVNVEELAAGLAAELETAVAATEEARSFQGIP